MERGYTVKEEDLLDLMAVEAGDQKLKMGLKFQVADVVNPLIAVKRLTEKGNFVCFGPKEEDCYIVNHESGNKMPLKPNGKGSYLMRVGFEDGTKTNIVVDSGAEENVCPLWWGEKYGLQRSNRQLHLTASLRKLDVTPPLGTMNKPPREVTCICWLPR